MAEGGGLVDLEEPVSTYLGESWSKATLDEEAEIKVRHLISMVSGLGQDHTFAGPAGSIWMYNTAVYSKILQVLEAASGLGVNDYTSQWLTSRIGMVDSEWRPRSRNAPGGRGSSIGFFTSARDLARFGLLVLAEGRWAGEDILGNRDYLERALAPSQELNPSYGYLFWLNGHDTIIGALNPEPRSGPLVPSAPDDLVVALGGLGRTCYVVPSLELVVTRLGDQPPVNQFLDERSNFDVQLWERLMVAAPKAARDPT